MPEMPITLPGFKPFIDRTLSQLEMRLENLQEKED